MARLFLDSGVLVAASRGRSPSSEPALALLENAANTFLTSPFVYLEIVPKARYNRRRAELQFYHAYFNSAEWVRDIQTIFDEGVQIASRYGVGPMDALHIAAATLLKADQLVTVEKPGKSIYRVKSVKVAYLFR